MGSLIMKEQILEDYKNKTKAPLIDSLTGLLNHGIFQMLLEEEIKRSQRYGDPFTLAFIDIDSFSFYNKQHTPTSGDRALKEVAGIIRQNLRNPDVAARYSGDLFAVILTKSKLEQAQTAVDRIRISVEGETNGQITVSGGLATFPGEALDKEKLIDTAKEALTQAKITGKNKVCFIEDETKTHPSQNHKILAVDDDTRNVKLLEGLLRPFNHEVFKAYNGEEALSLVEKIDLDLILLDAMMPRMDGFEVCRRLKRNEGTRLIPIIMLTALDDTASRIKGIESGADDFITKPPNKTELTARINALLKVNGLNKKMTSIENVIISMANAVEAKDAYTQGHTERVANLAVTLGRRMGLSALEIDSLWFGGILHDVGKIGVPREILNKPGPLNSEEFEIIKGHSDASYKICLPLKKILGPALEAIRHHHEKIDGSGYPDGLKGEELSVLARILAIADIFDALDTDRPYRKGLSREKTLEILCEEANDGKLDKFVVEHLIKLLEKTV